VDEQRLRTFVQDCLDYNVIAREVDSIGLYFREQQRDAEYHERLPHRYAGLLVDEDENAPRRPPPVHNLIKPSITVHNIWTLVSSKVIKSVVNAGFHLFRKVTTNNQGPSNSIVQD
jgi:hypothetical protein